MLYRRFDSSQWNLGVGIRNRAASSEPAGRVAVLNASCAAPPEILEPGVEFGTRPPWFRQGLKLSFPQ
jgi:hypothetical protein